jgi:2-amino-4-hydroxy-6-hydroxymethyldihydropteridine diphosphokinase
MEVGFSLGSNLGDRLGNLRSAKEHLLAVPGTRLLAQSPVYDTEPVGVKPAYRDMHFYNSVVVVESPETSEAWLERVGRIEAALGRERAEDRYAPRTIDIDLLYAGNQNVEQGGLTLPHPRWATRRFVVQPLADVRPDLVLPGTGRTVREVLEALPPTEAVTLLTRTW